MQDRSLHEIEEKFTTIWALYHFELKLNSEEE